MNRQVPQLHVGHGTTFAALTVFPVWIDAPRVTGLEWKADSIRIAEREGSPIVGELVLHNATPRPVVALEGDLLKGGWQDRMLAGSLLLEPFEARVVEAICVEHGRWGSRPSTSSGNGGSSGSGGHSGNGGHEARGRKSSLSVRHGNNGDDRQGEVWRRIGRYETMLGLTPSSSMLDHLDRSEPVRMRQLDGQRGVIIGIGGKVVGAELFGSSAGLRARWQGMLAAAALDARLAPPIATTAERARSFARRLMALTLEDGGDAGMARSVRSEETEVPARLTASGIAFAGGDLLTGPDIDRLIHLTAFDNTHPLLESA